MSATGGCLCGGVRYEIAEALGPAGLCHCEDCRRVTGGPFNVSVRVAAEAFAITAGQPSAFAKTSDAGTLIVRHFCADCGSPIYTSGPSYPEAVYVKAGTLDDPSPVRIERVAWAERAVSWTRPAEGARRWPREPD